MSPEFWALIHAVSEQFDVGWLNEVIEFASANGHQIVVEAIGHEIDGGHRAFARSTVELHLAVGNGYDVDPDLIGSLKQRLEDPERKARL